MRLVPVIVAVTSLAAGLLAALIPAGQALAAGPSHKVLLRDGRVAYVTGPAAKARPAASTPSLPKLVRDGRLQARPASVTPDASKGSISGRVTGAGHPLRGICVVVYGPGSGGSFVTTSRTGKYRLTDLRPGRYHVAFAANARPCPNHGNWLTQWYRQINSAGPPARSKLVPVRAGHDTPGIDARLSHGAQITGVVHSASGKALSGICVLAGATFGQSAEVQTNAQGRYTVGGLYPDSYFVVFFTGCGNRGNFEPVWWPGTSVRHARTVKVVGRKTTGGIDAILRPGAILTGTVRTGNAGHRPLGGVCLSASSDSDIIALFGPPNPTATTAKDGRFTLRGLPTGRYTLYTDPTCDGRKSSLYLAADQDLAVKAGKTSRVRVLLRPGSGVSGRVTDSHGRPIKGICVVIEGEGGHFRTGPAGRYKVLGLDPGEATVQFTGGCGNSVSVTSQFYKDRPDYFTATQIRFQPGQIVTGISAVMRPGASIVGTVTTKSGHPLSGMCVRLLAPQVSDFIGPGFAQFAFTNDAGHYRFANLAPGPYQLVAGCGARYAPSWFRSAPDSTTASFLSTLPGVTTNVDFKLERAGSISGTATDRAGHPLGSICVLLANAKTKLLLKTAENPATTGSSGRYRFHGLRAGQYLVQFSDCHQHPQFGTQWYSHRTTTSLATPVTVKAGQTTTGIDAAMRTGATISGTVTNPAGKPAGRTCIQAFDSAALSFQNGTTDRRGRYSLPGLGTGRYSLSFLPCGTGANLGAVSVTSQVTAPRTTTVDVQLKPGGSISGIVLDGGHGRLPKVEACVVAVPTDPSSSEQTEVTGVNGRYLLSGLVPGTYHVYFSDVFCEETDDTTTPPVDAPQWYRAQPTESKGTLVTVSAGHVTKAIDATLVPAGPIAGSVFSESLAGLGHECVTAFPIGAQPDPVFGDLITPEAGISTPSGHFALSGLFPGQYKVQFSSGCGRTGYADQWWRDATSQKSAKVINLAFTEINGIDALLQRR
jgi:hypothetical protein